MNILASQLCVALNGMGGASLSPVVEKTIAWLCDALNEGHVCLDLRKLAGLPYEDELLPPLESWRALLLASSHVGLSSHGVAPFKPFILDQADRFYFHRYYYYEQSIAERISILAGIKSFDSTNFALLKQWLDYFFDERCTSTHQATRHNHYPNWQKAAAASAVLQRVSIISGGPGTGKTTTVVRILGMLQSLASTPLVIRLAAPTGKAAARMSESIRLRKPELGLVPEVLNTIPETAETLHRLLGVRYGSSTFKHHRKHPLALDVLVVDEASMIDLALMAKVLDAIPDHARLILLGDKDQLDSVEAGSVFAEFCSLKAYTPSFLEQLNQVTGYQLQQSAEERKLYQQSTAAKPDSYSSTSCISNSVVELTHSFRFGSQPGIGALARYANEGEGAKAVACLRSGLFDDISLQEHLQTAENEGNIAGDASYVALLNRIGEGYSGYWEAIKKNDPCAAFEALSAFRVLVTHKEGERGIVWLNGKFEGWLQKNKIIRPLTAGMERWYPGKPVMVLENDYVQQLFNGDVGIALWVEGELRVAFQGNKDGAEEIRWVNPARLPRHEESYAMTVHKSQGSEFNEVLFLLPIKPSPVLTRNLIYTAITRAKKKVVLWGNAALLEQAIRTAPVRYSGLADSLQARANIY